MIGRLVIEFSQPAEGMRQPRSELLHSAASAPSGTACSVQSRDGRGPYGVPR